MKGLRNTPTRQEVIAQIRSTITNQHTRIPFAVKQCKFLQIKDIGLRYRCRIPTLCNRTQSSENFWGKEMLQSSNCEHSSRITQIVIYEIYLCEKLKSIFTIKFFQPINHGFEFWNWIR